MADTIMIELREEDAILNNANGDYVIHLPEPIPLYPLDIVEIKNIFVDSVEATVGSVVIDEDTDVIVEFSNYIMNWATTNAPARTYLTNDPQPDLQPYFACSKALVPNQEQLYAVGTITIYRAANQFGAWGRPPDQPPLVLNFEFPDPTHIGKFLNKQLQIPYQTGANGELHLTFTTNPILLPFFVAGTLTDLNGGTPIKVTNLSDILPSDKIDTASLENGNKPGTGRLTYENTYAGSKFVKLTGMKLSQQGDGGNFGNNAKITLEYKDWRDGLTKQKQFDINTSMTGDSAIFTVTPNIDCVTGGIPISQPNTDAAGTFKYIQPQTFPQDCPLNELPFNILTVDEDGHSDFFMNDVVIVDAAQIDVVVGIKSETESVTIKKGKYPLPQLCEMLTDGFSSLTLHSPNNEFATFPANNNFLLTVNQIRVQNNLADAELQYFVRQDGQSFFTYPSGNSPDPFVGTDQVAIIADATLDNKVKISAIHQNLLDITGSSATHQPVVQYHLTGPTPAPGQAGGNYQVIGRNGGIVFTNMTPQPFWEQLGFSYDEDKRIFGNVSTHFVKIADIGYHTQTLATDIGRYTTTSDSGLSNAVIKSNPYVFTQLVDYTAGGTTQANAEIVATNTVAQASDGDGYFMVEVNGIPQTSLIGSKFESNKVQAVISRYNTIGSYTSAYNEGSIPNEYKGEPTMIGSFNVRILNSAGQLSNDVENKSCIFLSITRANKTPQEQNLIN